jgi:hypothetical protein
MQILESKVLRKYSDFGENYTEYEDKHTKSKLLASRTVEVVT